MVMSSWHSHCESSSGSFNECRTAPRGRRQSDQANGIGPRVRLYATRVYTRHRFLLLSLLSPKADTHYGRRVYRPRYCMGVARMPKAVCGSSFRDEHI